LALNLNQLFAIFKLIQDGQTSRCVHATMPEIGVT
jgi:hypothetical protein